MWIWSRLQPANLKKNLIEVIESDLDFNSIGGYNAIKDFIKKML
jgi:hypothetical protein